MLQGIWWDRSLDSWMFLGTDFMISVLPSLHISVKVKSLSRVRLFVTPWTVAHQAPPSMGFYRQKYWSGLPFPSPGDLPDPGIKPRSPALQADALWSEPPGKSHIYLISREALNPFMVTSDPHD